MDECHARRSYIGPNGKTSESKGESDEKFIIDKYAYICCHSYVYKTSTPRSKKEDEDKKY
jgi:hypothetical protein